VHGGRELPHRAGRRPGFRSATHFVGYIPEPVPRQRLHYHRYDEGALRTSKAKACLHIEGEPQNSSARQRHLLAGPCAAQIREHRCIRSAKSRSCPAVTGAPSCRDGHDALYAGQPARRPRPSDPAYSKQWFASRITCMPIACRKTSALWRSGLCAVGRRAGPAEPSQEPPPDDQSDGSRAVPAGIARWSWSVAA